MEIILNNRKDIPQLAEAGFNIDYDEGKPVVFVTPEELTKLNSLTTDYEIYRADMNAWAAEQLQNRDAYHTYQEIIDIADNLELNYPDICKKYVFGTSVQGRQLAALKISDNVAVDENEAEVMFDGGIHGDEIGAAENVIRFAMDLCNGYNLDDRITNIIDNREVWLYLMVNPDGRENMSRYNANGVDINRDWPYMWNGEGSSNGAASQPETRALRDCAYDNQFVIHTTYHSGTEYVSCPWSYRSDQPVELPQILELAGVYSDESGYSNLEYGQGNTGMYPINGSSKDFNFGALGSVSWSMEISYDKQPPASQIQQYYDWNYPSMLAMAEYAGYGIEGLVTDAETGEPVQAAIFVYDAMPFFNDPEVGDFHHFLKQGYYWMTVKASGYEDQELSSIHVVDGETTVVNIEMTPVEDSRYACKVAACCIPGNNSADEGYTPGIIGAPDEVNYSVGKNGWIVFDMQHDIIDGQGDDITIFEGDDTPEGYSLFAGLSIDGPWVPLGDGQGTTSFDLAAGNVMKARYYKLLDDGDGNAQQADCGFDFDAAKNIAQQQDIYLFLQQSVVSDAPGNNNGIPEVGEDVLITIDVINNGILQAEGVTATLECADPDVIIPNPVISLENIDPQGNATGSFAVTLAPGDPGFPTTMALHLKDHDAHYTQTYIIDFIVGAIMENFETGDFSQFPWTFSGNLETGDFTAFDWVLEGDENWQISSPGSSGDFCAASGNIGNEEQTSLVLTATVLTETEFFFYKKVSSEDSYDFLQFYLDNQLMDQWSGESPWERITYTIPVGLHEFRWTYTKDTYSTSGSDKAWLDNIYFPTLSVYKYGNLNGEITQLYTGYPVENATVTAEHNSYDLTLEMTTTWEGDYRFRNIPAGEYTVSAVAPNHVPNSGDVNIGQGETVTFDLGLHYGVGTDDTRNSAQNISIYPNPATDESVIISIKNTTEKDGSLTLRNVCGEIVYQASKTAGNHDFIIPANVMQHIIPGMYTAHITIGNELYISKIIKN